MSKRVFVRNQSYGNVVHLEVQFDTNQTHSCARFCMRTPFETSYKVTFKMAYYFLLYQQRNQAGSSPAMEFMGFKACMDYLIGYGLLLTAFVSDRHVSIAAYMRKSLTNITHYFDILHLEKSKVMHAT